MTFNFIFSSLSIKRILHFVLFIAYLSSSSCIKKELSEVNKIKFNNDVDHVQLENWHFLGPFSKDSAETENPIDIDFLKLRSGKGEAEIDKSELLEIANDDSLIVSGLLKSKATGVNILDYIEKKEGVVYLFCTIESKSDQDINFVFSGIQHAKLWLNNQFVYESEWKRNQSKYYEEYLPVKLKKGDNFLLLKLVLSDATSSSANWKFNFFASTNKYAKANYIKDYRFSILKESVIDGSLTAYLGPFINERIDYNIFDDDKTLVKHSRAGAKGHKNGTISVDINSLLKDRLYQIQFNIDEETIAQDFYYGDFNAIFTEISDQYNIISNSEISEKDKLNLEASFKRLQFVKSKDIEPGKPLSFKAHWDRSRVLFAKELSGFFKEKDVPNRGSQFNGFIKSYISSIDHSKQYYSSYIPKKLKQRNNKIPLVIISPFTNNPIAYLESWGLSNMDQILWDSKLAEEYGFGIIWIDLRGHPGLNEIAMTTFHEILKDVKSDHNIDEDRIFILGNSSASRKTLTLASRFPSLIAGCILYSPDVDRELLNSNGYKLENLLNASLYMQHSSKDEIVSKEDVEFLYNKMKRYSKEPILKVVNNGTHTITVKDSYRNVFMYIKDKKRNPKPVNIEITTSELKYGESYGLKLLEKQQNGEANIKVSFEEDTIRVNSKNINHFELNLEGRRADIPIKLNGNVITKIFKEASKLDVWVGNKNDKFPFTKNNLVEGPINHAFANEFQIVYSKKDESIKDKLSDLWKKVYFTGALSLRDIDVKARDIVHSNLILIGTTFDNKTIQNIVDQLPIKIADDHILFRDSTFKGQNIFISFVYPNPINPDKYIVMIASNGTTGNIPIKDFSNDGKSDFMIFNYFGNRYALSTAGNFDINWQ